MKYLIFLLVLLTYSYSITQSEEDILINEVCPINKKILTDSYGEYSNYVELINLSKNDIDISKYGLSDEDDNPLKFIFPDDTIIPSKSFLLIFLTKSKSTNTELHTGFNLKKNNSQLLLSTPDKEIIDKVKIPIIEEDYSYGRNTQNEFEIMFPSPNKKNEIIIDPPKFSKNSGFYNESFKLKLTSESDDKILYTIDGTNPLYSKTAIEYDSPIIIEDFTSHPNIYSEYTEKVYSPVSISRGVGYKKPNYLVDKAMIIRAVTKNKNGHSIIKDNTYFITDKNLKEYEKYTVISLITDPENFFDAEKGIYVTGNQYIEWLLSDEYDPKKYVFDNNANKCNFYSKGSKWERSANLEIFDKGELILNENINVRVKGASTRNHPQKNFNFFPKKNLFENLILLPNNKDINGNLINKYDSISLRGMVDDGRIRDKFSTSMINERTDLVTSDMNNCILFLNGEYWGGYVLTEKFSDYFFESHYGIPKKDITYINSGELEEGDKSELDNFYNFFKEIMKEDLSLDKTYEKVDNFLEINSFMEHYATGIYLGTYDWPNHNFGVWKNTGDKIEDNIYSDGKWRFVTFDLDYSIGVSYMPDDIYGPFGPVYDNFKHIEPTANNPPTNLFVGLLRNNKKFRNKFMIMYCDYANQVMMPYKSNKLVKEYKMDVSDIIANTNARWWSFGQTKEKAFNDAKNVFDNSNLVTYKNFFIQRPNYTLKHMKEFLKLNGTYYTLTIRIKGKGKIKLNTIVPTFINGMWKGKYYQGSHIIISVLSSNESKFIGWSKDIESKEKNIDFILENPMELQVNFE